MPWTIRLPKPATLVRQRLRYRLAVRRYCRHVVTGSFIGPLVAELLVSRSGFGGPVQVFAHGSFPQFPQKEVVPLLR
jgi:hypothetical protein